jgi:hypothetical protein
MLDRKKLERFWGFFFAVFSVLVALATLTTMNRLVAAAVILISILLGIVSAVYFLRSSRNPAFKELVSTIPISRKAVVRSVRSETELQVISNLDREYFGADSVDYRGLLGWWKRYPDGVQALVRGSEIVGAVGIWPLSENAFRNLIHGKLDEIDIRPASISKKVDGKPRAYWYFGDIVIAKKHKKRKLSLVLLEGAIRHWLNQGNLPSSIEICAFGFTAEGIALLDKFGFLSHLKSNKGYPVFVRAISVSEMRQELEERIVQPQRAKSTLWIKVRNRLFTSRSA